MTYVYTPLHRDISQIRVIELIPEIPQQSIIPRKGAKSPYLEYTMRVVDLDDKGRVTFTALSYTWGDPKPTRDILVNGGCLAIRENLWDFLQVAAKDPKLHSSPLWIDQICIDQNSNEERNHQVGLMGRIYSEATNVFMWLGTAQHGSHLAMKSLGSNKMIALLSNASVWKNKEKFWFKRLPIRVSLHALLRRPYWQRLWIVQEILIGASERRVVLCGKDRVPWTRFRDSVEALHREALLAARYDFLGRAEFGVKALIYASSLSNKLSEKRLADLVLRFGNFQCADPRDRVYGLTGLTNSRGKFRVDYNMSPAQVFIAVLEEIVSEEAQDHGTEKDIVAFSQRDGAPGKSVDLETMWKLYEAITGNSRFGNLQLLLDIVRGTVKLSSLLHWVVDSDTWVGCDRARKPLSNYGQAFENTAAYPESTCDDIAKVFYDVFEQVPRGSEMVDLWLAETPSVKSWHYSSDWGTSALRLKVFESLSMQRSSGWGSPWQLVAEQGSPAWELGLVYADGDQIIWCPGGMRKRSLMLEEEWILKASANKHSTSQKYSIEEDDVRKFQKDRVEPKWI